MNIKQLLITSLLFSLAGAAICDEIGVIRPVDDVLKESYSVWSVTVDKIESQKCSSLSGDLLTKYSGRVLEVYKGPSPEKIEFDFCGYSGLIDYGSYVIGFDGYSTEKLPYFGLDAVFIEHGKDTFYRMLSYESHTYKIKNKQYLVLGVEQPGLKVKLQKLSGDP